MPEVSLKRLLIIIAVKASNALTVYISNSQRVSIPILHTCNGSILEASDKPFKGLCSSS